MIENVYSTDAKVRIDDFGGGFVGVSINAGEPRSFVSDVGKNEIISQEELKNEIKLIKEEYESQLQRQKVHISRGDEINGNRILGRRYKIAIPKRCFRNQESIKGCPNQGQRFKN